jgi:hypothetical protein
MLVCFRPRRLTHVLLFSIHVKETCSQTDFVITCLQTAGMHNQNIVKTTVPERIRHIRRMKLRNIFYLTFYITLKSSLISFWHTVVSLTFYFSYKGIAQECNFIWRKEILKAADLIIFRNKDWLLHYCIYLQCPVYNSPLPLTCYMYRP